MWERQRSRALLAAGLLAACYSPQFPAEVPCDPVIGNCPSSQVCAAAVDGYRCVAPSGGDASSDVAPDTTGNTSGLDSDFDGVPDQIDNCVSIANPDQYNEDGDRFGDACDPCPPVADDNPPDGDGDGVADACDPRPATPGDHIVLFEGFQGGIPVTWSATGSWTAVSGAASVDTTGVGTNNAAQLMIPGPTTTHETVSASVTIDALATTGDASAGVVDDFNAATKVGLYCHVTRWTGSQPLILTQLQSGGVFESKMAFEMTAGQSYVLQERRDATSFSCVGARGAVMASGTLTTVTNATTPLVGLRTTRTRASFAWVMVVSN